VEEQSLQTPEEVILWPEFLESTPPGALRKIKNLFSRSNPNELYPLVISKSDIQLYCDSDVCGGIRFFGCISDSLPSVYKSRSNVRAFIDYRCRNCQKKLKEFSVRVYYLQEDNESYAIKFGEHPQFGPPIPPRLISLIRPDREIFIRGCRAENQGLGIGAFAYYRRVVENQKGRLIKEIEKVARRLGATPEVLEIFEDAANQTQFSTAIDKIKDAIPQSLLIRGHNPLSLLHTALSQGLHAQSDEECLEIAQDIRIVFTELAERISQALKDETALSQAVSRLLKTRIFPNTPEDITNTEDTV
jgi:hypothetical protein